MKDIRKIRDSYNKAIVAKLLDYCNRNERFLSNVLLNNNKLDNFVKFNKIEKID
jgi:hypothetical protein